VQVNGICRLGMEAVDRASNLVLHAPAKKAIVAVASNILQIA
jgi:hypothetical protein